MTTFLGFTYNCLFQLNQYFRTFWPIKVLFGAQLKQPSEDTQQKLLRAIFLLKHKKTSDRKYIIKIVKSLPVDEDIMVVLDPCTHYNILQQAVLNNDKELVFMLVTKNAHQSNIHCNEPVHLAAFLGYYGVLELLLENGQNGGSISGMCYPDLHIELERHKLFGVIGYPVYRCSLNSTIPVYRAIEKDNVQCVKLILSHMAAQGISLPSPSSLLHFACRKGMIKCMKYFIQKHPEAVNSTDANNDTPLLSAVVWGSDCARCVIENGADVNAVSRTGETALHKLYRNDIDGLFTIYDTTKYLLTTGIEQLVNRPNDVMETPLHYLVTHVSFIGGDILHRGQGLVELSRVQLQPDYQEQVVNTLELLMRFNADPHEVNHHGLQPINRLMHVALKSCDTNKDNWPYCVRNSIDSKYLYKNDFSHLQQALEILLRHGSDPNAKCHEGHSPYLIMLQCMLEIDIAELCAQTAGILNCFEKLLKHGANPNFMVRSKGYTCATVLAKIALRFFDIPHSMETEVLQDQFADFVSRLLNLHFTYGLNPNFTSYKKCEYLKGGGGNAMIEFIRLGQHARVSSDFVAVHLWLRTILQWGANPDLEPYPSEPIICHSQSAIFLKHQGTQPVSHYIHGMKDSDSLFEGGHAEDLLMLFYNTMSHQQLYECLNTARSMTHFHPLGATGKDFLSLISRLSESPRSLSQIARVAVYKSLNRDLATKIPQLPLPNPVKNYLLDVM